MFKPLKPYDDRESSSLTDHSGGYSIYALQRMLTACQEEPVWRPRADIACAYYDGKQLSEEQRAMIRAEMLEERAINLIRPVINSVLGQEAKSRTDVSLMSDADDFQDVCDALNPKLKEAQRESYADMAVSNGYAAGVKAGLGWVEVGRNIDPLAYPYMVQDVPRNEIWWDWIGQRGVKLNQSRWLVRKRWVDLDEAMANFTKYKDILYHTVNGWKEIATEQYFLGEPDQNVVTAYENEQRFKYNISSREYVDSGRKMIKMYEVWYRVPAEAVVLHLSPTKKVIYDEKDPRHVEAVSRGIVKISKTTTMQVRQALFAGPHRLVDRGTKLRRFPYIPFFAFRDDATGAPYGLIDGMIAPQDDYNDRSLRIQWMLKARQTQMDSDALDPNYNTIADIRDGAMRPDLMIITNPNRINRGSAVTMKNDLNMQPEQFRVLENSKLLIQETAGRYSSQLGNAQVQSGVANSLLIEQGEQAMGEMNDNYAMFRRQVFESITDLIVEDHLEENMQVKIGTGSSKRIIVLNAWDQEGMPVNMVKDCEVKVGMAEIPATPAYRQQSLQQVAQIIQALGGNQSAIGMLAPAYIENSMLNNRMEIAKGLRKLSGIPDPQDKESQNQADQAQQQALAEQQALQAATAQATAREKQASAAHKEAQAEKTQVETLGLRQAIGLTEQAAMMPPAQPSEQELIQQALAEAEA